MERRTEVSIAELIRGDTALVVTPVSPHDVSHIGSEERKTLEAFRGLTFEISALTLPLTLCRLIPNDPRRIALFSAREYGHYGEIPISADRLVITDSEGHELHLHRKRSAR